LTHTKAFVLRYWETEFSGLRPVKGKTGHRLYRRKDVELVLEIKRLLYEKRYTIEGARKFLDTRTREAAPRPGDPVPKKAGVSQGDLFRDPALLLQIRKELTDILELLD
jgi:DNA-binding transcriptional MerR regulator